MSIDFVQLVNKELKRYGVQFTISPKQLRKFSASATLNWNKVKFTQKNNHLIPANRGIYAFVVEHNGSNLPYHGYIMYIGISGDSGNSNLRNRYRNYLDEMKKKKRSSIYYMLNNWGPCLFFHYAEVSDKRVSLHKLEMSMSDALIPPYSTNDFSAEIREGKRAFR